MPNKGKKKKKDSKANFSLVRDIFATLSEFQLISDGNLALLEVELARHVDHPEGLAEFQQLVDRFEQLLRTFMMPAHVLLYTRKIDLLSRLLTVLQNIAMRFCARFPEVSNNVDDFLLSFCLSLKLRLMHIQVMYGATRDYHIHFIQFFKTVQAQYADCFNQHTKTVQRFSYSMPLDKQPEAIRLLSEYPDKFIACSERRILPTRNQVGLVFPSRGSRLTSVQQLEQGIECLNTLEVSRAAFYFIQALNHPDEEWSVLANRMGFHVVICHYLLETAKQGLLRFKGQADVDAAVELAVHDSLMNVNAQIDWLREQAKAVDNVGEWIDELAHSCELVDGLQQRYQERRKKAGKRRRQKDRKQAAKSVVTEVVDAAWKCIKSKAQVAASSVVADVVASAVSKSESAKYDLCHALVTDVVGRAVQRARFVVHDNFHVDLPPVIQALFFVANQDGRIGLLTGPYLLAQYLKLPTGDQQIRLVVYRPGQSDRCDVLRTLESHLRPNTYRWTRGQHPVLIVGEVVVDGTLCDITTVDGLEAYSQQVDIMQHALYLRHDGQLQVYYLAQGDMDQDIIRLGRSISEDPTQIFAAIRFAIAYNAAFDDATQQMLCDHADKITIVSLATFRVLWDQLFRSNPIPAVRCIYDVTDSVSRRPLFGAFFPQYSGMQPETALQVLESHFALVHQ